MKLEIDIPSILYNDAKENRRYISVNKMEIAWNAIADGKPLEQETKTGHWIEHPHEAGPCWEYSRYECSECHDWAEDDSDYCPYCGAKMETEDI